MSIEEKIAALLEESKKLQEEQEEQEDYEVLSEEEFKALSEEEQAEYELQSLDEISSELKQRYVKKVTSKVLSKKGNRDLAAYTGRTYTGRETPEMEKRGEKLNKHVNRLHKMNNEELTLEEDNAFEEETKDLITKDQELTIDVSADVAALVNGEELTEEFKTKAATIFEAAVITRVKAEVAKIEEQFDTKLAEQVEEIKEGLVEKVDGYLNYVVEQWMKDNELALEHGVKTEIMESFIAGMKGLFEQHYIDVPEEKFDLVSDLQEEAESTKAMLDEQLAANVELSKQINEMKRVAAIGEFSASMADTDAEKFNSLAEELAYDDAESFKTKLQTIKENYFGKKTTVSVASVVTDEPVALDEEAKTVNSVMAGYLKALNK